MRIYSSLFLLGVLITVPLASFGQEVVYDPSVYQQTYQNYLQLVAQLNVLQQQATYLQQSLNAIKTLNSDQYTWSNVSDLTNQLGNVVSQTKGLSYSSKNIDTQFQKAFPGYQPPKDANQQDQQNLDTTLNTLSGALKTLNLSSEDFANEPKRMEFLQSQVQNAKGQTQVLQASAQISTEMVSQLQLLRQTMMTQANAQNVYYAQKTQAEASDEAGFNQMLKNSNARISP